MILLYRYPSYCAPNIWPHTALPELEMGMLVYANVLIVNYYGNNSKMNTLPVFLTLVMICKLLLRSRVWKHIHNSHNPSQPQPHTPPIKGKKAKTKTNREREREICSCHNVRHVNCPIRLCVLATLKFCQINLMYFLLK